MLVCENIRAGYGSAQVLHSVSLKIERGVVTGLVGLNGAGKSTLLKTLAGVVKASSGKVLLNGEDVTAYSTQKLLKKGVALVPEGRHLFLSMTVLENLKVSFLKTDCNIKDRLYYVYSVFPDLERLKHKKTATLSGGQAQMVAFSRALMSGAGVLLLDEPTMGLSPKLCGDVFSLTQRLSENLDGVLVTGQEVGQILKVSHTVYGVKNGAVFPLSKNPETVKKMIY